MKMVLHISYIIFFYKFQNEIVRAIPETFTSLHNSRRRGNFHSFL